MLDLIYDGQCGFCVRALRVCRALDVRGALRFHDATARTQVYSAFPELLDADFDHAMFAVAPDRCVTRGFFAFRRALWESPLLWPLLPVFYFPGAGRIGPIIYAWIARNRRRFGCDSSGCDLTATPRNPRR
jgi:predicted DCC family thiol-disulfide oxidoreductase YuxK